MGLLDKIIETTSSIINNKNHNPDMVDSVLDLFKENGINGIVNKFKNNGLGDTIDSWISKGKNMPVSTDQIKNIFGAEKLQELAQKRGVSSDQLTKVIKDILPDVIDNVTPNGKIESNEDDTEEESELD